MSTIKGKNQIIKYSSDPKIKIVTLKDFFKDILFLFKTIHIEDHIWKGSNMLPLREKSVIGGEFFISFKNDKLICVGFRKNYLAPVNYRLELSIMKIAFRDGSTEYFELNKIIEKIIKQINKSTSKSEKKKNELNLLLKIKKIQNCKRVIKNPVFMVIF